MNMTSYCNIQRSFACLLLLLVILPAAPLTAQDRQTPLFGKGITVIPYPKEVTLKGDDFISDNSLTIVTDDNASPGDRLSAHELQTYITHQWGLPCNIDHDARGTTIVLTRKGADKLLGDEGYSLTAHRNRIIVRASDEAGLFYGVQTLMQLGRKEDGKIRIPGLIITDWPDTKVRAAHYDTKHHQDNREFVEQFIRDLSRYKYNMLIWEWEDKFEYPSHPEIGAPGAFTVQEMQQLTAYAKQYHIQIVPLVQGLGHAGFILKWPQFAGLRELPASNFEFCPLKEGSYQLLSDLWHDAIKATPGSQYIHIGSDETFELGQCPDCRRMEHQIGKSGLYNLFVNKAAQSIHNTGRNVMVWEPPMGWLKDNPLPSAIKNIGPEKGLVLTESYDYETPDLQYARQARRLGYQVYAYDPNPGIEMLFLPYFFSKNGEGDTLKGCLENSYAFLKATMGKGVFDGVIRTSWDDSGLPMQSWMLCFAMTAAYAWNAAGPSLAEFTASYFANRYGQTAVHIDSLYRLLNEGAYFYMESFERRVWAWGEIGKTHLPDLPRGDALEYDPYWNTQYAGRVAAAKQFLGKMDRAIAICRENLQLSIDNRYDIEVFMTLASLIRETASTYLALSHLEQTIKHAHEQRFVDLEECYQSLQKAEQIVRENMAVRDSVFNNLIAVWERTRLPKGMSTPTKKYFFEQERTRHFANRVPDMSYLIYDEQKLDLAGYLARLEQYTQAFHDRFLTGKNSH